MLGHDRFTVTPRRGELIVFDKLARPLVGRIILAVPTKTTKGVLIAPTVYGNVMLGPTAEDVESKQDTASTAAGLAYLRREGERIVPELLEHEVTAVYAGLRAATEHARLPAHRRRRRLCLRRRDPLHWALGLDGDRRARARRARGRRPGMRLEPKADVASVRMPNIGERCSRPYAEAERIARDPEYGRIVCFCERVSSGEIRDALASPIPPADLDGLRRRTRALMGRCQGFFCGARVAAMLDEAGGRSADATRASAP